MPFKSKKQRKWMHANEPEMADKWEKETPKGKALPEKVKTRKKSTKEKKKGAKRTAKNKGKNKKPAYWLT